MSVFSITALDRLIEPDRRSSSAKQMTPSMEKRNYTTQGERRPFYAAYPYSSTTPLSPRARSPSPTDFSPSPYVVNHKRRVPSGLDSKRASQQNGFHVPGNISASRPTESQELALRSGKENVSLGSRSLNGVEGKQGQEAQLHQSSLTRELLSKNSGGESEDEFGLKNKNVEDNFRRGRMISTEEKMNVKRSGWGNRDMNSRVDDLRGKQKLDERLEEGTSAQGRAKIEWGNASTSARSPHVPPGDTISSTTEEWYDAPDAPLSEDSSDDEAVRSTPTKSVPSARGDPDPNIASQLEEEIKRRIKAEEAVIALQQQRDGMAQMLSSAGISLPRSEQNATKLGDYGLEMGISESEAERLTVARMVAVAVAKGAVRAEAEEELQTVLAEKSKEIARLRDKLQYYETLNHEMSQRNQESIETARQTRRRRQRRQRFAVLGLSAAICFGVSAAVVYHYVPWEHIKTLSKGSDFALGDHISSESGEKVVDFSEPVTDSSYD